MSEREPIVTLLRIIGAACLITFAMTGTMFYAVHATPAERDGNFILLVMFLCVVGALLLLKKEWR
jgi:drug/metabolite transporter (DMT)-like permease